MKLIFIYFICLTPNMCIAAETITFDSLHAHHGQEISIRGFYYETKDNQGVIAAQPNLKTCCIGSAQKIDQQIIVANKIAASNRARALQFQGSLSISPSYDPDGNLKGLYYLNNVKIVEETHSTSFLWIAGIIATLLCIILFFRKYGRHF